MKLLYTLKALRDIEAINSYLSARSSEGARTVALELERAIAYIVRKPKGSPPTDKPNVRVKWVNGYRYQFLRGGGRGDNARSHS